MKKYIKFINENVGPNIDPEDINDLKTLTMKLKNSIVNLVKSKIKESILDEEHGYDASYVRFGVTQEFILGQVKNFLRSKTYDVVDVEDANNYDCLYIQIKINKNVYRIPLFVTVSYETNDSIQSRRKVHIWINNFIAKKVLQSKIDPYSEEEWPDQWWTKNRK